MNWLSHGQCNMRRSNIREYLVRDECQSPDEPRVVVFYPSCAFPHLCYLGVGVGGLVGAQMESIMFRGGLLVSYIFSLWDLASIGELRNALHERCTPLNCVVLLLFCVCTNAVA